MRRLALPPEALGPGPLTGALVSLPEDASHYLLRVLRAAPGQAVELFDGQGRLVSAALEAVSEAGLALVRVARDEVGARGESPLKITLYQAIARGDRFEEVLEKVTELGVWQVVPLMTARTVVQIAPAKAQAKQARWEKIVAAAARQCERACTPHVQPAQTMAQAIAARAQGSAHLVAHPGGPSVGRALAKLGGDEVGLWVGPEGGFSPEEVDVLGAAGARHVGLGPRVLRTDTAGIVLVALAQQALGDL